MKRVLVAGAVVTAALFGAAFLLTSDGPVAPLPVAAQPDPVPDEGPVAASAAPARPAAAAPLEPPSTPTAGASAPATFDPAAQLRKLEPLRREVGRGLAELDRRVDHCRLDGLMIYVTLESLDRTVRIAETRVAPLDPEPPEGAGGEATPAAARSDEAEAARCVAGVLDGVVFGAPSATPGRRWELPWTPGPKR